MSCAVCLKCYVSCSRSYAVGLMYWVAGSCALFSVCLMCGVLGRESYVFGRMSSALCLMQ